MRIASERGVAPRLHHADARTGVTIMDRIAGTPLRPTRDPAQIERVAAALRRLHDGPPFPRSPSRMDFLRSIDAQCAALAGAGRQPSSCARSSSSSVRAPHAHAAACHRDLNPNNVLVAAERGTSWTGPTRARGDPFIDLAQLGVFACPRPEQREALLEAYLGGPRTMASARGRALRAVALAFYAASFFFAAARLGGPPPEDDASRPLAEVLSAFGAAPERTHPGVVAAALLREMRQEAQALDVLRG